MRLADVFVSITDPRQAGKVAHDLVELLVVAVNAVVVGADTFVEIELWAQEKLDWLRRDLTLENGIPSHDMRCPGQLVCHSTRTGARFLHRGE